MCLDVVGYREAERALEEHLRRQERIRNQPRYGRPTQDPLVRALGLIGAQAAREGVFEGLGRQVVNRAGEITGEEASREFAETFTGNFVPNIQNALVVASAQTAIQQGAVAARQIEDQFQEQQERAIAAEEAQLERRLDAYRDFYQIVNQLNFQSVENFIASTIRATANYLQQLAIRDAAERAYADILSLIHI